MVMIIEFRLQKNFQMLFKNVPRLSRRLSDSVGIKNSKERVRVRFAPSPTGHLHLGGLRTALYNYLFAKSKSGEFVLRIEDTDQKRIVPGAADKLESDLKWTKIYPDESPSVGGPYGPYKQSERLELYRQQVNVLLSACHAYRCFCTERRLDLLRKDALKQGQIPHYDNRCRNLSASDVQERLNHGDIHCIRFKLSSPEPFMDLIYGKISNDVTINEGDPVIMKADGFPTYHFANVVDDHFMKITHVLRGVEWQISTSKHIMLYRAFGWHPPIFGHLPLIMNQDGTKLSKRQGGITIQHFQNDEIFPLALLNFVVSAGGGFERSLNNVKPKIYTVKELVENFSVNKINVNSCRLSPERLNEFNRLELQRQIEDEKECKILVEKVKKIITGTFKNRLEHTSLQLDDNHVGAVLRWSGNRINKLTDLAGNSMAFLWIMPSTVGLHNTVSNFANRDILKDLLDCLSSVSSDQQFKKDGLKQLLKKFASDKGLPFSKFMKLLRSSLSGLEEGPAVAEMMEILGPERSISRIQHAITLLENV